MNCEVNAVPICPSVVVLFRCGKSTAHCRTGDRAWEAECCEPEMIIVASPGYEHSGWRGISEGACPAPVERCRM